MKRKNKEKEVENPERRQKAQLVVWQKLKMG